MSLLEVEGLHAAFGGVEVVGGVSFTVEAGETLAIVGESGSGKSVSAMSIMRLLPSAVLSGQIRFKGRDLLALPEADMRRVRGSQISMVFQEPMTALNPVMTVGEQIAEAVRLHQKASHAEAWRRALEMMTLVGIPAPERRMREFPHKLSGGMRQRVAIAMALACDPALLIADEPTTALDVTVQAQILDLIRSLKVRMGSAVILITHDLGVVAELADRVAVMYAGRIVEQAPAAELFANPTHPYTRGLLAAAPQLGSSLRGEGRGRLTEIRGSVPNFREKIVGCAFAPRCDFAEARCHASCPNLETAGVGRSVACHRHTPAAAA